MISQKNLFRSHTFEQRINEKAPVICKRQILINADASKVWAVLTDIDNWINWQKDISKSKLNGLLHAGSTFDWKSSGVHIHSTIRLVETKMEIGWTGKSVGLFAIHNWMINDINGQTQVLVEESMEGFLAKLFKNMFNRNLDKGLSNWLNFLKAECEK